MRFIIEIPEPDIDCINRKLYTFMGYAAVERNLHLEVIIINPLKPLH